MADTPPSRQAGVTEARHSGRGAGDRHHGLGDGPQAGRCRAAYDGVGPVAAGDRAAGRCGE